MGPGLRRVDGAWGEGKGEGERHKTVASKQEHPYEGGKTALAGAGNLTRKDQGE